MAYRRTGLGAVSLPAGYSLIGDGTCMFGGQNGQGGAPMAGYAPPDWFFTTAPNGEVQCLSAGQVAAFGAGLVPIQNAVAPGGAVQTVVASPVLGSGVIGSGVIGSAVAPVAASSTASTGNAVLDWVSANPLLAAGIAGAVLFVVVKL